VNNQLNQSESLTNLGDESEILESFLPSLTAPETLMRIVYYVVAVLSEVATENWNKNYGQLNCTYHAALVHLDNIWLVVI